MEDPRFNPLVMLLSGGTLVAIIQAAARIISKRLGAPRRPADMIADYEKLVDQLQQEVGRLTSRVSELEAYGHSLREQTEEREAALEVKLQAVRDGFRIRIEGLYADLEQARIRIGALEVENRELRLRLEGNA